MAYIRTCVQNLGEIRRPVRNNCPSSLIVDLHTGIFGLIPLCPCDNCCIVFHGPTSLLRGLK